MVTKVITLQLTLRILIHHVFSRTLFIPFALSVVLLQVLPKLPSQWSLCSEKCFETEILHNKQTKEAWLRFQGCFYDREFNVFTTSS